METGFAAVDNDHRALIDQINALGEALHKGAGKEQLASMIAFLNTYVREHFSREEHVMQLAKCPATGQNCSAHKALLVKLDAWVRRLQTSGATTSLVLEINREASAWIQQHIINVDCQLRSCAGPQTAGPRFARWP